MVFFFWFFDIITFLNLFVSSMPQILQDLMFITYVYVFFLTFHFKFFNITYRFAFLTQSFQIYCFFNVIIPAMRQFLQDTTSR